MHIDLDGVTYPITSLGEVEGIGEVTAIHGLPESLIADLARMSQVVDVPHTWRVKQASSVEEVANETVSQAIEVIRSDQSEMGANIFCYVRRNNDDVELVAAGAIRNKLSPKVKLDDFPVCSRALVAPQLRGRGMGRAIIRHRADIARNFFDVPAKAVYFGSRASKVVDVWTKFAAEINWPFFYLGEGRLAVEDGVHIMKEYFMLNPEYENKLLAEATLVGRDFIERLKTYFSSGANEVSADTLAFEASNALTKDQPLEALTEFFKVREIIGAKDPQ